MINLAYLFLFTYLFLFAHVKYKYCEIHLQYAQVYMVKQHTVKQYTTHSVAFTLIYKNTLYVIRM